MLHVEHGCRSLNGQDEHQRERQPPPQPRRKTAKWKKKEFVSILGGRSFLFFYNLGLGTSHTIWRVKKNHFFKYRRQMIRLAAGAGLCAQNRRRRQRYVVWPGGVVRKLIVITCRSVDFAEHKEGPAVTCCKKQRYACLTTNNRDRGRVTHPTTTSQMQCDVQPSSCRPSPHVHQAAVHDGIPYLCKFATVP